ncbi:sterol desaturase [Pseudoalteromonas atlantica]|jgi:sterol desaturase/sphingolipid hydroxylase (fatty acid hydroxylase superfamily)|uniref:Sterol desaturase n=2 Tax=Pseudoalteromonas TaxID=53246 RepID=A0ABQ0UFH1_PSEAF|nr:MULTISPECIES: sterol desaturase family protein [Pseudoalteromonas]AZN33632.1 sterol desaturase family protein [Pseudoalteromonas sp. Xi13]MCQ8820641.1 sterol desaturase family protein [Pseudoalteromonas agarivorans]TMO03924.1 sterol desaturase family protein [Pseudoalteromonas sp. S327]TMO17410.1 sterol desaturase family protein [Pseudoalteromonas sp. S326]GEK77172.1 sterol desaturase [Pseudoalteromonas atlantica]
MNSEIILLALSPVFLVFVCFEFVKFKRYYNIKDSLANTVLALLHQGADAMALLLLMPFFYMLYEYRLFDIKLSVLSVAFAFLLQDFLYYWFHRASHHIHWLWAAHVVHHSSTKMNFTTAFRQSIMYPVAGMWVFWLPMILLGFDPLTVFSVVALNLAYQFFVHTQIVAKLGWFESVFNTPSHHRVHHAINKRYLDKNFAGVLIIWDKLFGTFVEEDKNQPCKYGIVGQLNSNNPLIITFHQWAHLLKSTYTAKGLKAKCKVLFGYPTSSVKVK